MNRGAQRHAARGSTRPSGSFPGSPAPAWARLCSVLLVSLGYARAGSLELQNVIEKVRAEVNPNEAMGFLMRIHETDRWFTFPKFQDTAAFLRSTMERIGLEKVELEAAPADGVTQFGFWTMPLAWDVRRAVLEIVEPPLPSEQRVLADYEKTPASLVMWSGPTPPEGIQAEVVELPAVSLAELRRSQVEGKMVLAELPADLGRRGALKAALYRLGAAGLISCSAENPELLDAHYWVNAWGDHGWAFTKSSSPLPGFSVTPRQAESLRRLLARHKTVRVRAIVDSRLYAGTYPYVTGVVSSSGSGEEVLLLAHTSELGAQDNATGVAAILEAAATLRRLLAGGKLSPPRRAVRILAMPEDYGSMAYIVRHPDRIRRTIGAVNVDSPAGPYEMAGTAYRVRLNPDVARSYQDALAVRVAESYYAALGRPFPGASPFRPTSDSYLSDPLIGVPTIALQGGSGVNVHHSSADTIARVDPRSLRDLSALLAVYAYCLASAGEAEIPQLAQWTADRAYANMLRGLGPHLDRILQAKEAGALAGGLHSAFERIAYDAERDAEALLSLARLAAPERRASVRSWLEPFLKLLDRFAADQKQRVQRAAEGRALELGLRAPVRPVAPGLDARRAEAARIVVRRKGPGPVTLDDLPFEQREGYPGFAGVPAPLVLLLWCDGKRNLAEVIRRIELEWGPMDFDFVGYFRFLARHGYVEILPAGSGPTGPPRSDMPPAVSRHGEQ
jgi:aminopeptidase-like protein